MTEVSRVKNALIEETILQINKVGFNRLSLRRIAANCGVTHSAVYKHFSSKQALIEATYPYIWSQLYFRIDRAISSDDGQEKAVLLCKEYVRFMVEFPQYHYLMNVLPALSDAGNIPPSLTFRDYLHHYGGIIIDFLDRRGVPQAEHICVAQICSAMLDGIVSLLTRHQIVVEGDYTDLVDRLMVQELRLCPQNKG